MENAVEHGLHATNDDGEIILSFSINKEMLEIDVMDTGVGVSPELCDQLNKGQFTGYGLENIHKRLQVYYGDHFKLNFANGSRGGFKVHIAVPYESCEEQAIRPYSAESVYE